MKSVILLNDISLYTCVSCSKPVQKAIFESAFYPNLFIMLLAFMVLGAVVLGLSWLTTKRERTLPYYKHNQLSIVPLVSAATILGIGIGGFIDGIVFHQILQWHEMLSNKIPPVNLVNKSVNMFWDGIFHAFSLLVTLIGINKLFQLFSRTDVIINRSIFTGSLLLGWGLFNIVEGLIDHHLLKLHNVREITDDVALWNFGFLFASMIIIGIAIKIIKAGIPKQVLQNVLREE